MLTHMCTHPQVTEVPVMGQFAWLRRLPRLDENGQPTFAADPEEGQTTLAKTLVQVGPE